MDLVSLFQSDTSTAALYKSSLLAKVRNFSSQGNSLSIRLSDSLHLARMKAVANLRADRNQLLVTVVTRVTDLIAALVKLMIMESENEQTRRPNVKPFLVVLYIE